MASSLYDHFRIDPEHEDHGGELIFNTRLLGSIPFRGSGPPALRQDEYDELETRGTAEVRTFDLGQPEDLHDYKIVLHRIVNGWYVKLYDHHHFDSARQCMIVHLEWCQLYKETPSHLARMQLEGGPV